jgi:hypothetical protein
MEPFNYKRELIIRPIFYVPNGNFCTGCAQYDFHADWCELFKTDITEDKKNFRCVAAATA